jgi:predicted DCC family thiol-disulfide oxidoreductase YuxK
MKKKLKIFYDGACLVCHTEIEIYRKHDENKQIEFIDISLPTFSEKEYPVTKKDLNKYFHIQTPNGLFIHGVPAFMEIWQLLPKWQWLEKLTNNIICRPSMKIGYFIFVYIRPYLPKRKNCESGSCNI